MILEKRECLRSSQVGAVKEDVREGTREARIS